MDMNNSFERNEATVAQGINPTEVIIIEKSRKEIIIKNLIYLAFILIPLFSVEGVVAWSIGGVGLYKTVNIFRSDESNKVKRSLKILAICLGIAIAYNIAVGYFTKIMIALTV